MRLTFRAINELQPGEKWAGFFRQRWPAYRQWWLSRGELARPSYLECRKALATHMPQIVPLWERLVDLAGGGDYAARFLSAYCPPPYLAGCSQAIWAGDKPLLVRNYDYSPAAFDAVVLRTRWLGRKVLGMSDCLIGVLDGINEDGLAVSLTFGGRREVGPGFGIPLVLRYLLETCSSAGEAARVLQKVPCHMAYNVTALDRSGNHKTIFVGPDRPAMITEATAATNHQRDIDWSDHARATSSVEREAFLLDRLKRESEPAERFIAAFQRPPLYSPDFAHGFGTLYTAVYGPQARSMELRWPGKTWPMNIKAFRDDTRVVEYTSRMVHEAAL